MNLRIVAEEKLEEAPAVSGCSWQICAELSQRCALQVAGSFGSEDIAQGLPARRLPGVYENAHSQLAERQKVLRG